MADMNALVITAPGRCELARVPVPEPRADQLLVKVEGCGVCGSNLPRWEGRPWFQYRCEPGSPGHEGCGRVVGTNRRVAFLSDHAFAEYDVAAETAVVDLPDGLELAPGEPLGCAINIWRRSAIERGHTVAVVGIGFLGALLVQYASLVTEAGVEMRAR